MGAPPLASRQRRRRAAWIYVAAAASFAGAEADVPVDLPADLPVEYVEAFSAIDTFADAAAQNMEQQLASRVPSGSTCLVTALEDANRSSLTAAANTADESFDGWMSYLVRHEMFVKALLRNEGNRSNLPLIVMAPEGKALQERHKQRLVRAYTNTLFVTTLEPPEVIAQGIARPNRTYTRSGFVDPIISVESISGQLFFYSRLQMFTMTACTTIVAIDTGDMLPRRPFLDDTLAILSSEARSVPASAMPSPSTLHADASEGAASTCRASHDFVAPPVCHHPYPYFNAGFFAATRSCLGPSLLAGLLRVALVPPRPSRWDPTRWTSDQDTLNAFFNETWHTRMPSEFNLDKRYLMYPPCRDLSPRILHYVSSKPSVPHNLRPAEEYAESPRICAARACWR